MHLKIWHKMIIGISVPFLIVIFGGFLSYEYLNDVKIRQGFVQIADNLTEQALEVRRNEKNFLLHKNDEYYQYCVDAINKFNHSIGGIATEVIDEIGEKDFSLLRSSIKEYSTLIQSLLINYRHETDLVENVREEGRKLESSVTSPPHAGKLSTDVILNLRRLEKNYMLFRDRDSFVKLETALSGLEKKTPYCVECSQYIEAIRSLFLSYRKSDSNVNDLQVIGIKLEEITNETAESERKKVNSFITLTQRHLYIAVFLLCTLGPFFVYKTSSYIVAPIKRLAEITRRISEGDINLRAPIREHDETYSLAISFNTMLDHLQLTQISLENSLELLHEKQAQLVESKKLASIGTLAAGVAHELNNPLNNIYTTAQRLIRKSEPDCPHYIRTGLDDIFGQTMRVKKIVGDLLEFARGREPQMRDIELNGLIKGAFGQITATAKTKNINFTLDSQPGETIYADPAQIEQVFINLFSNAIDAMPEGGSLSVKTEFNNASVKIWVSDTGTGMSNSTIEKIFEPFFTTKDNGTGLGLAIVFNIIQKHNGLININSEEGKGTTFMMTLPKRKI